MLGGLGGDFHATLVVWTLLAFKYSCDLAELAADFDDHLLGGAADSVHRHSAEQEGHHGADEYACEHPRIHQVDLIVLDHVRDGRFCDIDYTASDVEYSSADMMETDLDLFDVGCQEGEGSECGGTDGESLAGGCGCVAEGIEGVGTVADFRIEFTHLGVAACIVGDRAVGIGSQGDSQSGKHSDGRDGYSVQTEAELGRIE